MTDELYHYGIKGMHWGVRRYQNPDGSLTSSGRAHYTDEVSKLKKKSSKLRDKAKKYEKKSSRWYRTKEGHVKYNKKKARKMVKADKIDEKISDIQNTLLSSNKKNIESGKKALERLFKDPEVKRALAYKKAEEQSYNKLIKEGKNVEDYLASPKSMDSRFARTKMEKKIDSAENSKELQKAGANYYISRNEADTHTGNVSKYYSLKADSDKKVFTKLLDEAGIKYDQKDIDVKYGPPYLYRYTTNKQRYIYDRY